MGFNEVYRTLEEFFPQIDRRALRATAVEHSKDVDAAVETVLEEVIPFFTIRTRPDTPKPCTGRISVEDLERKNIHLQRANDLEWFSSTNEDSDRVEIKPPFKYYDPIASLQEKESKLFTVSPVRLSATNENSDPDEVEPQPPSPFEYYDPPASLRGKKSNFLTLNGKSAVSDPDEVEPQPPSPFEYHDQPVSLPENKSSFLTLNDKSAIFSKLESISSIADSNDDGSMSQSSKIPMIESTSSVADTDDDGSMSQSRKSHMIDALSKIVADANNNKRMLLSAMDSVISYMREVKHCEQGAEQAKVEAAMGSPDILVKSEELKQMVKQAEETNSKHAGEVYGEKAILATELRELQSRAVSLSVERDKYLAVLDEMKETLEVRLAKAWSGIVCAEMEKMEKKNAAKKALTEQELIMEKVLQESKILKQQAEDNAKLREFLVDRSHVVDTLQGEISVICQDVMLLKKKFDEDIPLSESLSSSQTNLQDVVQLLKKIFDEDIPLSKSLSSSQTSFILASSGSSSESSILEQVESLHDEGADDLLVDTQEKEGAISCSTEDSSHVEAVREPMVDTQEKEGAIPCSTEDSSVRNPNISDDEWEICDYEVPS